MFTVSYFDLQVEPLWAFFFFNNARISNLFLLTLTLAPSLLCHFIAPPDKLLSAAAMHVAAGRSEMRPGCILKPVTDNCRAVVLHTADSTHKQVPLCSHNADYMDSLHEPVNTLVRIWWWPPEDSSCMIRNMSGWSEFCDFNVFFNKYVHKLVTTDNVFIDARFNYETKYCTCFAINGILWISYRNPYKTISIYGVIYQPNVINRLTYFSITLYLYTVIFHQSFFKPSTTVYGRLNCKKCRSCVIKWTWHVTPRVPAVCSEVPKTASHSRIAFLHKIQEIRLQVN